MTVAQLRESMSAREFSDWVEWFEEKHQAHEQSPSAGAPETVPARSAMHFDLTNPAGVAALALAFDKGG